MDGVTVERRMLALVWTGPRAMELRDVPTPQSAADEVLIEVRRVGICGSELSGYLGTNSLRKPPLIMGHEAAGRIVIGSEAAMADGSPARVGARVTFNPLVTCGRCAFCLSGRENLCRSRQLLSAHLPGAFARYVKLPARQCWTLGDDLSDSAGALAEPLACAARAVGLAGMRAGGGSFLILGAGPIGLCCLAVARSIDRCDIMMTDVDDGRLATAQRHGAHHVFNARGGDVEAAVKEHYPQGVDVVIDAVGSDATREQAVRTVVPGGKVVLIGLHDEVSPLAANYVVRQEITLYGCFAYTHTDFALALRLLHSGALVPSDDWVEERPLAAGGDAFAELVDGRAAKSKIILQV